MKETIREWIRDYVESYKVEEIRESLWRQPLVEFLDANNPEIETLKQLLGPDHLLPEDLLEGARSVILVFVPFSRDLIRSHGEESKEATRWEMANNMTSHMLDDLKQMIAFRLEILGYQSSDLHLTCRQNPDKIWSNRHLGHLAGLGTLGLNGLLITNRGVCGRLTTLVCDVPLLHKSVDIEEKCLYKARGTCKKCLDQIPILKMGQAEPLGQWICSLPCSHKDPTYN